MTFFTLALFIFGAFLTGFATGFLFWRAFSAERLEQVKHLHWEIAKRDRCIQELQLRLERLKTFSDLSEADDSASTKKPAA
nr:MAG: hypothetical protein KatS3mg041_0302 [Bacteroidota bacterium]